MSGYKYPNIKGSFYMSSDTRVYRDILINQNESWKPTSDLYSIRKEEEKLTGLPSFIGYDTVPISPSYVISKSIRGKVINNCRDVVRPIYHRYAVRTRYVGIRTTTIAKRIDLCSITIFQHLNNFL